VAPDQGQLDVNQSLRLSHFDQSRDQSNILPLNRKV
jgi:hypothetical protein